MTTEHNKAVVRRFVTEVLAGGRIIEDDPTTTPDMMATLGSLMPAASRHG